MFSVVLILSITCLSQESDSGATHFLQFNLVRASLKKMGKHGTARFTV
ncbi:hypothetical protein SEVIR_5G158550v4 [Setaria viridis]